MISDHNLGALMGAPVFGPGDEKIGTVGQVFVDPDTGKPNWVTVHTGLFGRHESFVPVEDATWDHEILHVPFEKDVVKDAPRIDTGQALSPTDETSLYRYYRIPTENDQPSHADQHDLRRDDQQDLRDDEYDDSRRDEDDGLRRDEPDGRASGAAVAAAATAPGAGTREDRDRRDGDLTTDQDAHDANGRPDDAGDVASAAPSSGRTRMRRYVIVEEEVPVDGDSDRPMPGDSGTLRS